MEKKLADFRARRQAENVKTNMNADLQWRAQTVYAEPEITSSYSPETEEEPHNMRDSPQSSAVKVRLDSGHECI